MREEWIYLIKRYSEPGARDKFENICASLFKKKNEKSSVRTVKLHQGDGGIDVFIGDFNLPIIVIQCKFFVNGTNDSQKKQIRDSFLTAIESEDYICSKWFLCIPDTFNIEEHKWWSQWKAKMLLEYQLPEDFIELIDGEDLIDDLRRFDLYDDSFDEEHRRFINEIHEYLIPPHFNLKKELLKSSFYISELKNYFSDNKQTHIQRKEVSVLLNWVKQDLEGVSLYEKLLIVKGKKGVGKSTILKDVYNELIYDEQYLVLALKCDQLYDINLDDLAKQLFLNLTSFRQLVSYVNKTGKKFVVILDQLDALSQSLSYDRRYIQTYVNLLIELINHSNFRIIISTRTFDLEYDADLRKFGSNPSVMQIEINELSEKEVSHILTLLKIETKSRLLMSILRNPYQLELFTKIPDIPKFLNKEPELTLGKLYSELWIQVLSRKDLKLRECLYTIISRMYDMHPNVISEKYLEEYKSEILYLISHQLLLKKGDKLSFFHQSFYEYYLARWFVESNKDLIKYILEEDQNLYIRSLIKNVIEYTRESNHPKYINIYSDILNNEQIRFHIKYLFIVQLGNIEEPTKKEKAMFSLILSSELGDLLRNTFNSKSWMKYLLNSDMTVGYENQIVSIFQRNINHIPTAILDYIDKSTIENKEVIIENLIPYISSWHQELIYYFDKYYIYNQQNQLWYFEILKKIAVFNLEFVYEKLYQPIIESSSNSERLVFDYRYNKLIDFLYELDSKALISFLIKIHLVQLEKTRHNYYSASLGIKSPLLGSSKYVEWLRYNDGVDEKSIDFYLIKYHQQCQKVELKEFYEEYKNENYVPFLTTLIKILRDRAEEFVEEILELLEIISLKNGLKAKDDFFQLNIRLLISKSILFFNKQQLKGIKSIVFEVTHPYEIWKDEKDGKKKYSLNIGRKKYLFIKALPEEIINNDIELRKELQMLQRRYGEINHNQAFDASRSRSGVVGPPISGANYERFSLQAWAKSMRKINENYKSSDFFKGGLLEHARVFERIVENKPDFFFEFIDKLFLEKEISSYYISHGISGLIKANYDSFKILKLVHKEIMLDLNEEYTLRLCWNSRYLINEEKVSDKVVDYWINLALRETLLNDVANPDMPLSDFINSVRGAAVYNLLHLTEYPQYQEKVFSTIEYLIKPESNSSNTILCGIMSHLSHLTIFDLDRSFDIFRIMIALNNQLVLKYSVDVAQYFNNNFHEKMGFYFNEMIKHEELYEECYFFVTSWLFVEIDNYKIFNDFILKGEGSVKCGIKVAETFLLKDGKVSERALHVLEKCLEFEKADLSPDFATLTLRTFFVKDFEELYGFLEKYVVSSHFRNDPRYLLIYLTKSSAKYPVECLSLLEKMIFPEDVDMRNKAYVGDELLTLVLSLYSKLRNDSFKYKKEQEVALDLFDSMLNLPVFRNNANQAMENILN